MAQAATDSIANTGGSDNKTPIDFLDDTDKSDLLGLQKQHIAEEKSATDEALQSARADRDRAAHYLDRQGVGPDDIPKWDADQERRKYETNPIESFGSLASVFAIAASAFTKTPMDNALNGAAAAMHAVRDKDDEAYKRAFDAWKANTDLTIKRHQMMHEDYQDAVSLMSTDMQLGEAKLKAMAARFGDQKTLFLMEHGMFPEMFQMMDARNKSIQGMIQTRQMTDEYTMRKHVFDADPRRFSKNPQEQMQAFNDAMGIKTDEEHEFNMRYWASHPSTGDPKADFDGWVEAHKNFKYPWRGVGTPGSKNALVVAETKKVALEHPEWDDAMVGEEANRRAEAATAKRTTAVADQEQTDKMAAKLHDLHPERPDEDNYRDAKIYIRGGSILGDDAAKSMAELWLRGDHSVFSNLGRGAQGGANVAKVWEQIHALMAERKITPDQVIQNVAETKGLTTGQQTLFRRQANIIVAAEAFEKVAPTVTAISDKIDRTKYPDINSILVAAKRKTGDESVVRMAAAINGAINTYSRAINAGAGNAYISDKEHAREILDIAYSKGQMRAAIDQLTIEINAELTAPGSAKDKLNEVFAGATPLQLPTKDGDDGWIEVQPGVRIREIK
jgi:hypothetical protein